MGKCPDCDEELKMTKECPNCGRKFFSEELKDIKNRLDFHFKLYIDLDERVEELESKVQKAVGKLKGLEDIEEKRRKARNPTPQQRRATYLVIEKGLSPEEAANEMGVGRRAVQRLLQEAWNKVCLPYKNAGLDEETNDKGPKEKNNNTDENHSGNETNEKNG